MFSELMRNRVYSLRAFVISAKLSSSFRTLFGFFCFGIRKVKLFSLVGGKSSVSSILLTLTDENETLEEFFHFESIIKHVNLIYKQGEVFNENN